MEILEVNCFALKNDGTLLIKTEMVEHCDDYRYCFYISKGAKTIFKSPYDKKSFLVYKADSLGEYKIKAFVQTADKSNKVSFTIGYNLTSKNAGLLAEAESAASVSVAVENIRDRLYALSTNGPLPNQAQYAWYVFQEGVSEPIFRGPYSGSPAMLYEFHAQGSYYVKLFIKQGDDKSTIKSDLIII